MPKKKRKAKKGKRRAKSVVRHCSKCGRRGHNRRSCGKKRK